MLLQGKWKEAVELLLRPSAGARDEVVQAFVKCGPVDEVLEQIEPFWNVVDSLCPMTPYRNLTMEQLTHYNQGIYAMVAEAKRREG